MSGLLAHSLDAFAATLLDSSTNASSSSSSAGALSTEFVVCFLVLGSVFALLSLVSAAQWVRFVCIPHTPFFMVQKSYALLLFIASARLCLPFPSSFQQTLNPNPTPQTTPTTVRTVFFLLSPTTQRGRDFFAHGPAYRREDPLFTLCADVGELLYLFAFSLLGLFWAQVSFSVTQRAATYRRVVRPLFFVFLALCTLGELTCWVLLFSLPVCVVTFSLVRFHCAFVFSMVFLFHLHQQHSKTTPTQATKALTILHSKYILEVVMYCVCVFFTVWFASVVFGKVRQNPVRSAARSRKLHEVVVVSTACLLFLVFHTFTTLVSLVGLDIHRLRFAVLTALEVVCEFVPAVMLLYVLRNVPRAQKGPGITVSFRAAEANPLLR